MELHHVQLAMPPGEEQRARDYYAGVLELTEVPKPPELAKRGGAWFRSGGVELHLGVEADFRPARKAHPGIAVDDLDRLAIRLDTAGYAAEFDEAIPGVRRFHTFDPFGNRIEFLERG